MLGDSTHHVGLNGFALHVLPALERQAQLPAFDADVHERGVRVHVARHVALLHVCRQLQRPLQLQQQGRAKGSEDFSWHDCAAAGRPAATRGPCFKQAGSQDTGSRAALDGIIFGQK